MVYLKSIAAGFLAVVVAVLLSGLALYAWAWWAAFRVAPGQGAGGVAYEVNTPWIPLPILVAVVFGAGFWWEFRRAKRT